MRARIGEGGLHVIQAQLAQQNPAEVLDEVLVDVLDSLLSGVHSRVRVSWAVTDRVDVGGVIGVGVSGSIMGA